MSQWYYYETAESGRDSTTLVNLALNKQTHLHANYPWLALVFVETPTSTGIAGLARIQPSLIDAVAQSVASIWVARVDRHDGSEFWFYLGDEVDPCDAVRAALPPSSRVFCSLQHDPQWLSYVRQFLPHTISQNWQVSNARLLEVMKAQGDDSRLPHDVRHDMRFESEPELLRAERVLQAHGFRRLEVVATAEGPYRVKCAFAQRLPQLTLRALNEATMNLIELAQACRGSYDGWNAPVVQR
jgi:hypothetical protein